MRFLEAENIFTLVYILTRFLRFKAQKILIEKIKFYFIFSCIAGQKKIRIRIFRIRICGTTFLFLY